MNEDNQRTQMPMDQNAFLQNQVDPNYVQQQPFGYAQDNMQPQQPFGYAQDNMQPQQPFGYAQDNMQPQQPFGYAQDNMQPQQPFGYAQDNMQPQQPFGYAGEVQQQYGYSQTPQQPMQGQGMPPYQPDFSDGQPPKKSKAGLIIGIVIGVLLIAAAIIVGILFMNKDDDDDDKSSSRSKSSSSEESEAPVEIEEPEEPVEIEEPLADGELPHGDITIYDDVFFYVKHDDSDWSYDDAIYDMDIKDNNMIFGAYAYTSLKDYSSNSADYSDIASRKLDFAYYTQEVPWDNSTDCESVVPVYVYAMQGSSKEFANLTGAYMGINYSDNASNPFYEPTLAKQQDVYLGLIMEYGEELGNEYFANYQQILNSSFISLTYLMADPDLGEVVNVMQYGGMYLTEVDKNGDGYLKIVDVYIDPYTFEMNIEDPSYWLTYEIDMADDWNSYTLTGYNDCSITLMRTDDNYLMGYVKSDSDAYMGIAGINVASPDYYTPESASIYSDADNLPVYASFPEIVMTDGTIAVNPEVNFYDGNIVTIDFDQVYSYATGTTTSRSVSIECRYSLIGISEGSNAGFALTDGNETYYYTYDETSYFLSKLDRNLVEGRDLQDILSALTIGNEIQTELISLLSESGIEANIDENTGHLILANGVMFAVDSANITADGKAYLDIVAQVYKTVVTSDEYADYVQMITVDGYADPTGDYDHNLVLSTDRAWNVCDYLAKATPALADKLMYDGHSYDNPIFDEEGEVDYEASRRVEIAIVIQMEDYTSSDSASEAALYGTYIGETYGSKLVIRSGGRGTFTNAGSTQPNEITWYLDGDVIVFDLGFGYEIYADYDEDVLYLYNDDAASWSPDTFVRY